MKLDLESLSAEPLVYMLMHSGMFVSVLGAIFFIIGLMFGYATWGRYKRQTRELRGEAAAMKAEIAQLKRKVGDHSVKSGPAIVIATETIHMPRREGETSASVPAPAEAAAAAPVSPPASEPITTQTSRTPTKTRLQRPLGNVIKAREISPAKAAKTEETQAILPLTPGTTPPPPARHASPLAAIITSAPAAKPEQTSAEAEITAHGLVPADTIPTFTDLPVPPPAVIKPEADLKLGLIYKQRPEHCDDLTALKGIAKVLEERLHALGIYTYAQIAAWNEDHIRELSARLAFKDRIQREQWVEQARQLAAAGKVAQAV
jgi:predicted flap endonuclease-1-like 5' DNA nuclease